MFFLLPRDFNSSSGVAHDINSFFSSVLSFLFWSSKFYQLSLCEASSKSWQGHNLILFYLLIFASFICIRWSFMVVFQGCDSFSSVLQDSVGEPQVSFLLHLYVQLFFLYPLRWYYSILVSVGVSKSFPFKNEIIKSTNSMIMGYFQPMISSLSYLGLVFT